VGERAIESFTGEVRDELLKVQVFTTLFEAQVLIENWRKEYKQIRPHSVLGYRPPAPEALMPGYGSTSLTVSVVQ
jgi:transposase InsO family protein